MTKSAKANQPSRVFISYADPNAARLRSAFNNEIMRLLTMTPGDYVATANVDATMTALAAGDVRDDGDVEIPKANSVTSDHEAPRPDLSSLLRHEMRQGGDTDNARPLPEILHGAHLAEALMAGRELVASTKRRPAERAICVISAKAGAGKTTLLAHLASVARKQPDRKIGIIDFGCVRTHLWRESDFASEMNEADLLIIDNADTQSAAPDRNALWSMLRRQVPDEASIIIAAGADVRAAANEAWRGLPGRSWDVTIGSFDCAFRRDLIGHLSRSRQKAMGGMAMPARSIDRLAEELWGNGWQIRKAVDAYSAYQLVMARQPTAKEIDRIAANVSAQDIRTPPSIEAIADAVTQFNDHGVRTGLASTYEGRHEPSSDVVLYLAKALTKHPLDRLARRLGLRRHEAVQSMHRIERAQADDIIFSQALDRMETRLTACNATTN